ncbi:hypothetical protein [Alishewanella jeotgali]|uniref:GTP-binding protein n=1 Tax=Alishewanella jeotgali KCTC 22429 TaxID=1129374 RepID=H3Z9T2_9ALTE|nr:hypothetical protein [Alishewanella jeotgali]EHR42606.1 GTP-binding protein [Alishewanella jeotgali KCTC 22429]
MKVYQIYDVWMALRKAGANLLILSVIASFICYLFDLLQFLPLILLVILIQSTIIYRANHLYKIDQVTQTFTFPASDLENSILAIVLMQPYWNLMRRKSVPLSTIENLYLDTQRWNTKQQVVTGTTAKGKTKFKQTTKKHVRYCLNVAGAFGSANLDFLSRQKRDEVRNALQQSVKNASIDSKVSEMA